jgi:hypothetical protein
VSRRAKSACVIKTKKRGDMNDSALKHQRKQAKEESDGQMSEQRCAQQAAASA